MKKIIKTFYTAIIFFVLIGIGGLSSVALAADNSSDDFTYEYYYKVKWGYFDEWMELYKRNHYPVLQRLMISTWIFSNKTARSNIKSGMPRLLKNNLIYP